MPGNPDALPKPNTGPVTEAIYQALLNGHMARRLKELGFTKDQIKDWAGSDAGFACDALRPTRVHDWSPMGFWKIDVDSVEEWLSKHPL